MIPYSIHVAVLLAICLFFYKLLLQKETYYGLNRIILLSCLVLAFVLPLIPVPDQYSLREKIRIDNDNIAAQPSPKIVSDQINTPPQPDPAPQTLAQKPVASGNVTPAPAEPSYNWATIRESIINAAFWIYCLGAAIFGINLLVQIIVLVYQAYSKPFIRDGIYRIVEIDDDKAPCSFGNHIFINPAKYDWETYNQILMHEKIHIRQRHTLDLLLAELMLVVQWFNPFAWIYRKELESNLEFLTDYLVLKNNDLDPSEYQVSLLKVSVPNFALRITTNYNQSLLKKRILMMNARRSNIHIMWKYLMLAPVCIFLVCILNKTVATTTLPVALSITKTKGDLVPAAHISAATEMPVQVKPASTNNVAKAPTQNIPPDSSLIAKPLRRDNIFKAKPVSKSEILQTSPGPKSYYLQALTKAGVKGLNMNTVSPFMNVGISVDYVEGLRDAGYKDLTFDGIRPLQFAGISPSYVKELMAVLGDTPADTILLFHANGFKTEFVSGMQRAGVKDLSVINLYYFKSVDLTPEYVGALHRAGLKDLSFNTVRQLQVAGVAPAYVQSLTNAGYRDLTAEKILNTSLTKSPAQELSKTSTSKTKSSENIESMYASGVPPDFVKNFSAIGYKDLSVKTLQTFYSKGITADFVRGFMSIKYSDLSPATLLLFYSKGVTAQFVNGFLSIPYEDTSVRTLLAFYSGGITSSFINGYKSIGYPHLKASTMQSFYSKGITSEFVKSFMDINYDDLSPAALESFYKKGITAAYVKSLKDAGLKDPEPPQRKR